MVTAEDAAGSADGPGIVTCAGCGCRYAAGAPRCPECPSTLIVAPGTGEPMTGTEHPADGTMSPQVSNEGDSESGEQVVQLPPRRPPSVTGTGGVTLPKAGAASAD